MFFVVFFVVFKYVVKINKGVFGICSVKEFYYLVVLNVYDSLVSYWEIILIICLLEMFLVVLEKKDLVRKNLTFSFIMKLDRICSWNMFVRLREEDCRKCLDMGKVFWVEGKIEVEKFKGIVLGWK